MLIQITQPLSSEDLAFLLLAITEKDAVLISGKAAHLALVKPELSTAQAFVDAADLAKLGGQCHSDWQPVSTQDWLKLTLAHEKTVSWS